MVLGPVVYERVDPAAERIAATAVVRVNVQSEKDWTLLNALAEGMRLGTSGYSRYELLQYGGLLGYPLTVRAASDHLSVRVTVPAGREDLAADLLSEVLQHPTIPIQETQNILDELPFRKPDAWHLAVEPWRTGTTRLKVEDLRNQWKFWMQPDKVTLAAVGAIRPGVFKEEVANRLTSWPKPPRNWGDKPSEIPTAKPSSALRVVRFFGPSGGNIAELTLAAIALGSGNSATVFQVWREKLGLSYRQEAFVVPGPRLVLAYAQQGSREDQSKDAKEAIEKVIGGWDEATLARAKAMAKLIFEVGAYPSPYYWETSRPLIAEAEDEALFAAYTQSLGKVENWSTLLTSLGEVTLPQVKAAALEALKEPPTRLERS